MCVSIARGRIRVLTSSGIIPKCQCPVAMQQGREGVRVGQHSREVGGCVQRSDQLPARIHLILQLLLQIPDIGIAILILLDPDHLVPTRTHTHTHKHMIFFSLYKPTYLSSNLPPGQQVGMVLKRAHKYNLQTSEPEFKLNECSLPLFLLCSLVGGPGPDRGCG